MQIGPKIRIDRHSLGNLAKNVAPFAAFTPLGVVGAGLLGAAGELGRGKNIGEAAKAGLSSAAQGAGATSIAGHFGVGPGTHLGFGIGSGGAPAPSPTGVVPHGNLALPDVPDLTKAAPISTGARVGHALDVGANFLGDHDKVAGAVVNTAGNLLTGGNERRVDAANADLLEQQANESRYDFDRRKARDAQLAPIWSSLGTAVGNGFAASRNPYLPAGG